MALMLRIFSLGSLLIHKYAHLLALYGIYIKMVKNTIDILASMMSTFRKVGHCDLEQRDAYGSKEIRLSSIPRHGVEFLASMSS